MAQRYRIDEQNKQPKIVIENEESQIRSIAKEVIKNRKFLYIDIN